MVAETEMAKDSGDLARHPRILPVRVAYTQTLPLRLRAAIGHLHHFEWRDTTDNDKLLGALSQAIGAQEWPALRRPFPTGFPSPAQFAFARRALHRHRSMWQSAGNRESVAGTTIVPVVAGQETSLSVTRATGPGFFRVKVLDSGALEVAIWSGANYRRVRSQPRKFVTMLEGDTHTWCFARYPPDQPVLLKRPDGRKDPIVVTFDEDVVRAVWMITHQRDTIHESFLIAMKHP